MRDVHIAMISSDEFAEHCCTAMASILYNINIQCNVYFYIITSDIKEITKKKIGYVQNIRQCNIKYIYIDENLSKIFEDVCIPQHVTIVTYMRLFIPKVLHGLDKILCLDSDLIVRSDISKLYNIDISGYCFAAAEDACWRTHSKKLWIDKDLHYFNTGVLLINTKKLLSLHYLDLIKYNLKLNRDKYTISDQDIINDTFVPINEIYKLDISWNFHYEKYRKLGLYIPEDTEKYISIYNNPNVIHFTGQEKPWYPSIYLNFKDDYLFYKKMTSFYKKIKLVKFNLFENKYKMLVKDDFIIYGTSNKEYFLANKKINKTSLEKIISFKQDVDQYNFSFFGLSIISKKDSFDERYIKLFNIPIYSKKKKNNNDEIRKELISMEQKMKREISSLKCVIECQDLHKATFGKYKNAFAGKDVVLVCTGPTAKRYIMHNHAIHVGVNGAIYLKNVSLDYLFIQDYTVKQHGNESLVDDAMIYKGNNCKKFIGIIPDINLEQVKENIGRIPLSYTSDINSSQYILDDLFCHNLAYDLSREPMGNFLGTVFSALQFILYTHPKSLYLVGWDCGEGYAYNKKNALNPANYQIDIVKNYIIPFINSYYADIDIISINPVGLKGIFKDIYLN